MLNVHYLKNLIYRMMCFASPFTRFKTNELFWCLAINHNKYDGICFTTPTAYHQDAECEDKTNYFLFERPPYKLFCIIGE